MLPDMDKAVERLVSARQAREKITIYGDYDIDGLSATTLLLDAFGSFGFNNVDIFIPNRFIEGYGLATSAIDQIAAGGTTLIVTVDCGSLSHDEIIYTKKLGIDVIITDHHNVAPTYPAAVAVVNPKRPDSKYPFIDLAGVGVAFKLVQALQTRLNGLPDGQEKWLLDLVALGTVCDAVTLLDENRTNVYFGLKVLARARRPGLEALMKVAGVDIGKIDTRCLGFALGPRMNAAGRLETARHALDMLLAKDEAVALEKAQKLDELNIDRRLEQDRILEAAILQAEKYQADPVLVVSAPGWNHGVVGIVASKLLEKYKKPAYVLSEMGAESKGSARSYGDFSAADAIRAADDIITGGGGHKLAAGVTLPTENIEAFRRRVNEFYDSLKLSSQESLLLPTADVTAQFSEVTDDLVERIARLEPFGNGNPQPILKSENVLVTNKRLMGNKNQHIKLELYSDDGQTMSMLAFNAPAHFFVEPEKRVTVWYQPGINEWNGQRKVESRLIHIDITE